MYYLSPEVVPQLYQIGLEMEMAQTTAQMAAAQQQYLLAKQQFDQANKNAINLEIKAFVLVANEQNTWRAAGILQFTLNYDSVLAARKIQLKAAADATKAGMAAAQQIQILQTTRKTAEGMG